MDSCQSRCEHRSRGCCFEHKFEDVLEKSMNSAESVLKRWTKEIDTRRKGVPKKRKVAATAGHCARSFDLHFDSWEWDDNLPLACTRRRQRQKGKTHCRRSRLGKSRRTAKKARKSPTTSTSMPKDKTIDGKMGRLTLSFNMTLDFDAGTVVQADDPAVPSTSSHPDVSRKVTTTGQPSSTNLPVRQQTGLKRPADGATHVYHPD